VADDEEAGEGPSDALPVRRVRATLVMVGLASRHRGGLFRWPHRRAPIVSVRMAATPKNSGHFRTAVIAKPPRPSCRVSSAAGCRHVVFRWTCWRSALRLRNLIAFIRGCQLRAQGSRV